MNFEQLQEAVRIFNLPERATLREIKVRHRALVKKYHPDSAEGGEPERIRLINEAYRVLLDYCGDYRFSFAKEEFFEQKPEERLREQFAHDGIWQG